MSQPVAATRPGVRPEYLVRRCLSGSFVGPGAFAALSQQLLAQVGMERVDYGPAVGRLELAYDASALQLPDLLRLAEAAGWRGRAWRRDRMRISWYAFSDANVRANARDPGRGTCSQSPLRFR